MKLKFWKFCECYLVYEERKDVRKRQTELHEIPEASLLLL
jgi:hypothetical protein